MFLFYLSLTLLAVALIVIYAALKVSSREDAHFEAHTKDDISAETK